MIIYYDTFNNMIKIYRPESKKAPSFSFEKEFDFDLLNLDNRIKATNIIIGLDVAKELAKEKNHQIIFSDDILGFGIFELPNLKKQRLWDVFVTKFRLSFPNENDYFYDGYEVGRDDKNIKYQFEFAKRENINKIINLYKGANIHIISKNIFASLFIENEKNAVVYPIPYLIVGTKNSELIVIKGDKIVSINIFNFGSEMLLNTDKYLNSGYNYNNEEGLRFGGFIKNHIANREEVNDANILKTEPSDGIDFPNPKEIRLLKGNTLEQYIIKNTFRKFYARLLEILEVYNKDPWFFPLKEINIIAPTEVIAYLIDATTEDNDVRFIALNKNIDDCFMRGIKDNPLYSKGIKKERRSIDWKAFLNMEIGGKKKKD